MNFNKIKKVMKNVPFVCKIYECLRQYLNIFYDYQYNKSSLLFRKHCFDLPSRVSEAVFVKVGANDGITGDPCSDILLANTKWKGLLIEPVPYCFENLKKNFYDSNRFSLEQIAIGATHGKMPFFFVDKEAIKIMPELPAWWDQLGSFDRNHILRHLNGALEPFIVENEVEVCSLSDVLKRNGIHTLHLLHIDTEGHDYAVLKTLDISSYTPIMIYAEHKHLSSEQKAKMLQLLIENGYSVRDCGEDYYALNKKAYKYLGQCCR